VAIDFFGAQDRARGRTKKLVALYFAAIAAITFLLYFVLLLAGFGGQIAGAQPSSSPGESSLDLVNPGLFGSVAGGVILVIVGASLYKIATLGKGGGAIARSVGGRQIDMSSSDPDERKLINIVEEMSIASGTPMPDIFILDNEGGINAFAAGSDINDAAIAVTRGGIQQLSRDELQGVVAHEFSHILSGDMRLNIRLIGPLFGLLVIAFLGRLFLYSGSGRTRGKNQGNLVLVGLAIMVVGYIGVFFGRLIQAAISRQREYLADASAVQFTRNPEGIGNALRRLGYGTKGSRINHAHSEDTAHMFFAKALGSSLATHPPLPKRIKAVMPNWDGSFLPPKESKPHQQEEPKNSSAESSGSTNVMTATAAIAAIGALGEDNLREGIEQRIRIRRMIGDTPLDQDHEARAIFAALLLANENEARKTQLIIIHDEVSPAFSEIIEKRFQELSSLSASDRFALIELCSPGLRKMDDKECESFGALLQKLADEDGTITLREALVLEVFHQLFAPEGSRKKNTQSLEKNAAKLSQPISQLLFLVASLDVESSDEISNAFRDAVSKQYLLSGTVSPPEKTPSINDLREILGQLNRASFGIRKQLLAAAADIVLRDRETSDREWTFLRLVSLSLGVPMPPLPASPSQ